MKLKKFRKLFRGLPSDTEIMLVADWNDIRNDTPRLESANSVEITHDEPQGLGDDGSPIAYLYHDPDKIVKK